MDVAQKLSQLRPYMNRSEIESILGPEDAENALAPHNGAFLRDNGISLFTDGSGIKFISFGYGETFPTDVAVLGVCIGMPVDAMKVALPGVALSKGESGEPNKYGFVGFQALLESQKAMPFVMTKDGKVFGVRLERASESEVLEWKHLQNIGRGADSNDELDASKKWKSIAEPDEMLLSWAANNKYWNHHPDQILVKFANELIDMPNPDVWHYVAMHWNWDYDHAPLLWIVRQENCDVATALQIFSGAEPNYYFRWADNRSAVPQGNRDMFDFLIEIRDRFSLGFYKRSEIFFSGDAEVSYLSRVIMNDEDRALVEKFYPREMFQKIPGRNLEKEPIDASDVAADMLAHLS